MTFIEALEGFVRSNISIDAVLKCFYSDLRIRSIVHDCMIKSKSIEHIIPEHAINDVATRFYENYLLRPERISNIEGIYSLIYRISEITMIEQHKSANKIVYVDNLFDRGNDVEESEDSAMEETQQTDLDAMENATADSIDKEVAGKELIRIFKLYQGKKDISSLTIIKDMSSIPVSTETGTNVVVKRRLTCSKKSGLTSNHQELAEIRNRLQISIKDYANELGLTQSCLTSYLYGRTQEVPISVIRAARALAKEREASRFIVEHERYSNPRKLINEWMSLLGTEDYALIGEIIQRHPVSIDRWAKGRIDPGPKALWEHDQVIAQYLKNRKHRSR